MVLHLYSPSLYLLAMTVQLSVCCGIAVAMQTHFSILWKLFGCWLAGTMFIFLSFLTGTWLIIQMIPKPYMALMGTAGIISLGLISLILSFVLFAIIRATDG